MAHINNDPRSIPELVSGLANDVSGLFRKEIQLAKAEASEKVNQAIGGVELLLAGGVLALGALGVLLAAIVTALGAFFISRGMDATGANSLASAIVGIIVAVIAWLLVARGLNALKGNNLQFQRTTTALERDAGMVKERL